MPCRRVLCCRGTACHIPGEGAWPDPFQLCPGEEPGSPMERSLGCRMRQLSHPVFGTVKTCCFLPENELPTRKIMRASPSAALPGSFQSREPAARVELALWLDVVGVPGNCRSSGMSRCSVAPDPTFAQGVWVFSPHEIPIIPFSPSEVLPLLPEIAPGCPGSCLACEVRWLEPWI